MVKCNYCGKKASNECCFKSYTHEKIYNAVILAKVKAERQILDKYEEEWFDIQTKLIPYQITINPHKVYTLFFKE